MSHSCASTILLVDDSPESLSILSDLLTPSFRVLAVTNGQAALRIAAKTPELSLILLDILMPDMDGYEVFKHLRANAGTKDIPVIWLTAMDGPDAELDGLAVGAVDYITKPIKPAVLQARVRTQLELKHARDLLKNQNLQLEAEIAKRMAENDSIQEATIRALASLAEMRDTDTGNHILRTQGYVRQLAEVLQRNVDFHDQLTDRYIDLLSRSAPLHDIGKVGIPDAILRKPGPLQPEQWEVMKTHARLGADAIARAQDGLDQPVELLDVAQEIAHRHHERWDGSGYPDGLAGEDIPVPARIMALADVFDALISRRVYKEPMSHTVARQYILDGRGLHFDPRVVDAFEQRFGNFCAIAQSLNDQPLGALQ